MPLLPVVPQQVSKEMAESAEAAQARKDKEKEKALESLKRMQHSFEQLKETHGKATEAIEQVIKRKQGYMDGKRRRLMGTRAWKLKGVILGNKKYNKATSTMGLPINIRKVNI